MEEEYLIQDNCTVATLWQFLFSGKIAFLSWCCRTPSANIVHLHFNFFRNAFPKPNTRAPLLTTGTKGLNVRRHKWCWCLIYVNYSEISRSVEQHCTGIWRNDTGRRTDSRVYFLLYGVILEQEVHCLHVCRVNSAHQFPLLLKMRTHSTLPQRLSCKD